MNYGLPYQGSKNKIAKKIIDVIPPNKNFIDLFFGGGAITHAAIVSNKYKHVIVNDIAGDIMNLFFDAVQGKYKNETKWISKEDFFKYKDTDTYVSLVWSFGNDRQTYLFGKYIEPFKKALWYARKLNDFSLLEEMNIHTDATFKDIKSKVKEIRLAYADYVKQTCNLHDRQFWALQSYEALERLQSLERLERLASLEQLNVKVSVEKHIGDYRDVAIPDNSIIYCDPPYANTKKYLKNNFNHQEFYDWCLQQNQPIVISEYDMPKPFVCIKEFLKQKTFAQKGNQVVVEKLFTTPKHIDFFMNKQLTLF